MKSVRSQYFIVPDRESVLRLQMGFCYEGNVDVLVFEVNLKFMKLSFNSIGVEVKQSEVVQPFRGWNCHGRRIVR